MAAHTDLKSAAFVSILWHDEIVNMTGTKYDLTSQLEASVKIDQSCPLGNLVIRVAPQGFICDLCGCTVHLRTPFAEGGICRHDSIASTKKDPSRGPNSKLLSQVIGGLHRRMPGSWLSWTQ